MTPEERQMLAGLFERVGSTASTPRDPQAEAFIAEAVRAQPHAPYALSQTVLVQQQALENASRRLAELEAQAKANAAPPEETSFLGSIGKSLFGGGQPAPAPHSNYDASANARQPTPDQAYQRQPAYAPPPYAPLPQAGPWGGQSPAAAPTGGGFMQSALTTAAGVAGGMVLAHSLGGLFGGHSGGFGGLGSGLGGGETVNNYYETAPDPAGQHAQDVLQDQDQDQDTAQDAADDNYSEGDSDSGDGT
jgi:hypothetical protein